MSSTHHPYLPLSLLTLLFLPSRTLSQSIANLPLPPMEWISLDGVLGGTAPTGLSGACLAGMGGSNGLLVMFGGVSESLALTSQTYILDTQSMSWRSPTPPTGQSFVPPATAHSLCTFDTAANFRSEILMYGGLSSLSPPTATSLLYTFETNYEFWAAVPSSGDNPTATFDSVGGINLNYTSTGQSQSNTLVSMGGLGGNDTGKGLQGMVVTGQISSNVDTVQGDWGTWDADGSDDLVGRWGAAGTTTSGSETILFSGCGSNAPPTLQFPNTPGDFSPTNASCAMESTSILKFPSTFSSGDNFGSLATPSITTANAVCPAPRIGGKMVPNRQSSSPSYENQAILIGGLFDNTTWDDGGNAARGEVSVLDVSSGNWARIIPASDNGRVPEPRSGAAVFALSTALAGARGSGSADSDGAMDVVVFGGRSTITGQTLDDAWVLRLYGGAPLTDSSNQQGLNVTYLDGCATRISNPGNPTSSGSGPTSTGGSIPQPPGEEGPHWTTSISHKALSGVSIALALPAILGFRYVWPLGNDWQSWMTGGLAIAGYATGIAGLALGFSTIGLEKDVNNSSSKVSRLARRAGSESNHNKVLPTTHSKAGIALWVLAYGVVPIWYLILYLINRGKRQHNQQPSPHPQVTEHSRNAPAVRDGEETPYDEKGASRVGSGDLLPAPNRQNRAATVAGSGITSSPSIGSAVGAEDLDHENDDENSEERLEGGGRPGQGEKRRKKPVFSWNPLRRGGWRSHSISVDQSESSSSNDQEGDEEREREEDLEDPESEEDIGQASSNAQGFEVVNRRRPPQRPTPRGSLETGNSPSNVGNTPPSAWPFASDFQRDNRASTEYFGPKSNAPSTIGGGVNHRVQPVTNPSGAQSSATLAPGSSNLFAWPKQNRWLLPSLLLQATLLYANIFLAIALFPRSKVLFGLFIVWAVLFYVFLFFLSSKGRPRDSYLSIAISRLRQPPPRPATPSNNKGAAPSASQASVPSHPYIHRPNWRPSPRSDDGTATATWEGDEDDDAAERDLNEREVVVMHTMTVPRRRLTVVNE